MSDFAERCAMGACSQRCEKHYNLTPRGELDVKGKGVMYTYWLDPETVNEQLTSIDDAAGLEGVKVVEK